MKDLKTKIQLSPLLKPEEKRLLLSNFSKMTTEQQEKLEAILDLSHKQVEQYFFKVQSLGNQTIKRLRTRLEEYQNKND